MKTESRPLFSVYIVDDEEIVLQSLCGVLRSTGINNLIYTQDSTEVLDTLEARNVGVMLLDLSMPNLSGEELLPIIHQDYPDLPIIIITGTADLSTAVECMKMGAFDYLVKPVEDNKLIATIKRAIEIQELRIENQSLKKSLFASDLERPENFSEIVSSSDKVRSILRYVECIGRSNQPVLITGETGVGKELIARAIHKVSERQGEFVPVNVAGFDDTMFADSLFGHVKGAFTGAALSRGGMIEKASAGTLFLDEIGDLSQTSQVKLLRLLDTGEYLPLGSDAVKRSKARVVVATNKDLEETILAGDFRKDLYFRLRTHHIQLPPLREHLEDLPFLVEHFLEQAARELGKSQPTPPPELVTLLGVHDFPGNIRELRAMIFDAVSEHQSGILSLRSFKRAIGSEKMPRGRGADGVSFSFSDKVPTINQALELLIVEVMKRAQGNQTIAARLLGITPQGLGKRLKKLRERKGETLV